MNRQLKFNSALLLIISMISAPVFAQRTNDRGFNVESADELSVKVFKAAKENGRITKIEPAINTTDPNLVFRSGELLTVSYSTNFEGYIYFINVGPEGTRVIFPANDEGIRPLMANEAHDVTLRLNQNIGREELILVVSRDRISRLDGAIRSSDKMLDRQTTSLPAINDTSAMMNQTGAQQQLPGTPSQQAGQFAPAQVPPSPPGQYQPPAAQGTPDQSGQPKKESGVKRFFKNLGIIAGSIGMNLVTGWLGPKVAALVPGGSTASYVPPGGSYVPPGATYVPPVGSSAPSTPVATTPPPSSSPQGGGTQQTPPAGSPAATAPASRGFELYQVDGNEVKARPEPGANGDLRFGAGQVGMFRMSLEHR